MCYDIFPFSWPTYNNRTFQCYQHFPDVELKLFLSPFFISFTGSCFILLTSNLSRGVTWHLLDWQRLRCVHIFRPKGGIRNICSQDYSFPGTFVPGNECSMDHGPWNIRSLDRLFRGPFVSENKSCVEHSFLGPFVPWNIRSLDLILCGTFLPWTTFVAIQS